MKNNFINKVRTLLIGILILTIDLLAYSAWGMPNKLNYLTHSPLSGEAFQHQVKGKVVDTNGMPIPGVHVLIKNTQQGTFTDNNGVFTITATPDDVLVIGYIGFQTVEIAVGPDAELSVVLKEDITDLGAVTVNAGYYTVSERERTGSISRITSKDIELQPVVSPLQALQGRMPGVEVSQINGMPGANPVIQIRGRNSLRDDGNLPLYIVDGVPISAAEVNAFGLYAISGVDPLS